MPGLIFSASLWMKECLFFSLLRRWKKADLETCFYWSHRTDPDQLTDILLTVALDTKVMPSTISVSSHICIPEILRTKHNASVLQLNLPLKWSWVMLLLIIQVSFSLIHAIVEFSLTIGQSGFKDKPNWVSSI